ncbi:MAG: hypothetical protein ACK2U9_03175, partial [Anaerolineae bacterium]
MNRHFPALSAIAAAGCLVTAVSLPAGASEDDASTPRSRAGLTFETGALWFSRNDVRIPGDTGTKFDMLDLTDSGPEAFARLEGT